MAGRWMAAPLPNFSWLPENRVAYRILVSWIHFKFRRKV
jgi:hypothetical protein